APAYRTAAERAEFSSRVVRPDRARRAHGHAWVVARRGPDRERTAVRHDAERSDAGTGVARLPREVSRFLRQHRHAAAPFRDRLRRRAHARIHALLRPRPRTVQPVWAPLERLSAPS